MTRKALCPHTHTTRGACQHCGYTVLARTPHAAEQSAFDHARHVHAPATDFAATVEFAFTQQECSRADPP